MNIKWLEDFFTYHLISILGVVLICGTIFTHYYGSRLNEQIARKYQKILSPLIVSWFRKPDDALVFQSPNIIKMYPSDRDSCLFAIISMALIPRQQILSFCFNPILFHLKDQIVVEIPLNTEFPISLTAAIVRKKQIKTITKKSFPDVKQLCKEYRPKIQNNNNENQGKFIFPDTHSLLIEKIDHLRYFLYSEKQVNIWMKHGKSVKLVYISDVNKYSRYPMAVRLVMNLNQNDLLPMLEWLMSFIDRMSKIKMSQGQLKQALKKRQALDIKYE